ncbi:e9imm peptide [Streptomyces sp. NPDC048411]|uniref:e9imm peptide n=1 Tax=Streptomyces sp. NPDC048411 TaxID=3157206 RepID=UPI0034552429
MAVSLVQRLLDVVADESETGEILDALERGLVCPHISDYIYCDSDQELSAEEIVDRALAYKPIAL